MLPALDPNAGTRAITERLNRLIREHNRIELDTFAPIYARDTGSATAYAMAPVPGIEQYVEGQVFCFRAGNANAGAAPTLAVNGLAAGTIALPGERPLAAGDIAAGGMAQVQVKAVAAGTPTFHLLNPLLSPAPTANAGQTTFLGSDVALNNTGLFFNGPNTGAVGAAGQAWLIVAGGVIDSPVVATTGEFALWDGSAYLASMTGVGPNSLWPAVATLAVVVPLARPTTFTLRANANAASAILRATGLSAAVANKATFITAVRLT